MDTKTTKVLETEFGRFITSIVSPTDLVDYDELVSSNSKSLEQADNPLGFGLPGGFDALTGAAIQIGVIVAGVVVSHAKTLAGEALSELPKVAAKEFAEHIATWIGLLIGGKGLSGKQKSNVRPFILPASQATDMLAAVKKAAISSGVREPALSKVLTRVEESLFD